ncbi:MAG TPA: BON domain-containing protein [Lysobacter sp.]
MTNRNYENRGDPHQPGPARGQHEQRYSQQDRGNQFDYDYQSDRYASGRSHGPQVQREYSYESSRPRQSAGRNQPYGSQFDERAQNVSWDEDRYEGGSDYSQDRNLGAAYRHRTENIAGQREYGTFSTGPGEYYGSDYNTYGRGQGYGEGSGYTRPQEFGGTRSGSRRQFGVGYQPGYGAYGGESAGSGGRTPMYGTSLQSYSDEGEMSGYRASSGERYGTSPYRSNRGRGPKNYVRSDDRIIEDLNERLTDDNDLDATEISVRCSNGTVTLEGTVEQRWMKHRAEDIADACSGVKEVDNRIQVVPASATRSGEQPGRTGKTTTGTTASGTTSQH